LEGRYYQNFCEILSIATEKGVKTKEIRVRGIGLGSPWNKGEGKGIEWRKM